MKIEKVFNIPSTTVKNDLFKLVLDNIKRYFIVAIERVNQLALQEGNYYLDYNPSRITIKILNSKEEFKNSSFSVSIIKGTASRGFNETFYLGEVNPFIKNYDVLKELISHGKQPDYQNIHEFWFKRFNKIMQFFNTNIEKIMIAKEKINQQFIQGAQEAIEYTKNKYHYKLEISPSNVPYEKFPLENLRFEPLGKYNFWKMNLNNSATWQGKIPIIENWDLFEKLVSSSDENDFKKIKKNTNKNIKHQVNANNSSLNNNNSSCIIC